MAAFVCVAGAVLAWLRPWADCLLRAHVTITTDAGGVAVQRTATWFFRSASDQPPHLRLAFDLTSLAGELALLEVHGEARGRWIKGANQQPVAFAAELESDDRAQQLPLGGWGFRGNSPACGRSLGPRAYRIAHRFGRDYWHPVRGSLWRVFRVPEEASLLLHARPVAPTEGRAEVETPAPQSAPAFHGVRVPAGEAERDPPDIFIYLVDALRADHLGCYGYQRDTSPNINAFSEDAVLYEDAQTVSSWTRPAVASLLTGFSPPLHGALDKCDPLTHWPLLLPEALKQAGYTTWSVVANPNILPASGFAQGYDGFVAEPMADAERINRRVRRMLARQDPARPLFLYVHTMEPHEPYTPEPDTLARFDRRFDGACDGSLDQLNKLDRTAIALSQEDLAHLIDRYDADICQADRAFAEFLSLLKQSGRYQRALIILLADHGEAFGEHGTLTHGIALGREVLRIPLIIRFPNGEFGPRRVGRRVSLVDVFPTVIRRAGLAHILDSRHAGRDLSPLARSESSRGRVVWAQISPPSVDAPRLVGVIDEDGYKRVIAADSGVDPKQYRWIGLWHTGSDPGEKTDLTETMPVRAAYGEQLIAEWLAGQESLAQGVERGPSAPIRLTGEMQQQLRALGYLR